MGRMGVIVGRESNGKTRWNKIGSAWPSDKGGFSITLDALPLPNAEGVCRMLAVEPKPRDEGLPTPELRRTGRGGALSPSNGIFVNELAPSALNAE